MSRSPLVPWLLRIAFAMCFIGHGAFGILQKRDWLVFFNTFGIGPDVALPMMPLVGSVDIAIGLAALFAAPRVVFAYGAFWCLFTAALRPLAGMSAGEFFERAGNFGVPIAILTFTFGHSWLTRIGTEQMASRVALVRRICIGTTAILLAGHGWLALESKPVLVAHASLAGIDSAVVPFIGAAEILLAAATLLWPTPALLATVCLWKIASESAFIAAGAPVWEFIERGGSYAAPLVAMLMSRGVVRARFQGAPLTATAALLLLVTSGTLSAQAPVLTPSLIAELQTGGMVVACRHGITSHTREDQMPPHYDDPSTQRVLSPEGEQQVIDVGRSLSALKIRFGAVLASPFQRTRQSAQSMAGTVTINDALSSASRGKDAELRALLTGPVDAGTNRLVVTHQGLLYRVFKSIKMGSVQEGDCLIVRPNEQGGEVAAQVRPSDWHLAAK